MGAQRRRCGFGYRRAEVRGFSVPWGGGVGGPYFLGPGGLGALGAPDGKGPIDRQRRALFREDVFVDR